MVNRCTTLQSLVGLPRTGFSQYAVMDLKRSGFEKKSPWSRTRSGAWISKALPCGVGILDTRGEWVLNLAENTEHETVGNP